MEHSHEGKEATPSGSHTEDPRLGESFVIGHDDGYEGHSGRSSPIMPKSVSDDNKNSEGEGGRSEDDEAEKRITRDHLLFLEAFDQHWNEIQAGDVDITSSFVSGSRGLESSLDKPGNMGGTILHMLATKDVESSPEWKYVFKWLMERYPTLYKVEDDLGWTVLASAAKTRIGRTYQASFVEFFVREFPTQTAELINLNVPLLHLMGSAIMDADCPELLFDHLNKQTMLYNDKYGNTFLHIVVRYNLRLELGRLGKQLKLIERIIDVCPESLSAANKAGQSPYRYRISTFYNQGNTRKDKEFPTLATQDNLQPLKDDPISFFLKYKIMQLINPDLTTQLLYGVVQEREIQLDLLELTNLNDSITEQELGDLLARSEFENILKYVRIPSYKLSADSKTAFAGQTSSFGQRVGRKDAILIFELLWKRGVRKIISITVDDDDEFPHSDVAIEGVAKFDIEEWDWKKIDICSEVVRRAAPNARRLVLYSSGNNAVLRSWSGIDGLGQLRKLTDIRIFIRQGVETEARTRMYMSEFMQRMHVNCPFAKIRCKVQKDVGLKTDNFSGGGLVEIDSLLGKLDVFAEFLQDLDPDKIPGSTVKVAVIDDGINILQGGFDDSIRGGVSFYTSPGTSVSRPYYFSSSGHGTLMANLIKRVCPRVQLYIARLDMKKDTKQLTATSASKAIRWAIMQEVDIISMSWAVERARDNLNSIEELQDAIMEADAKGILMFGSSNVQADSLPASVPGVICIGASNPYGAVWEWAALQHTDFLFPVNDYGIESSYGHQTANANSERVSSSSFATALASGFTALILDCIDICKLWEEYPKWPPKHIFIKDVLHRMALGEQTKYIGANTTFIPDLEELDDPAVGLLALTRNIKRITS